MYSIFNKEHFNYVINIWIVLTAKLCYILLKCTRFCKDSLSQYIVVVIIVSIVYYAFVYSYVIAN